MQRKKSVQTKSFSANENISLLYNNTSDKLYADQHSLIAKCKALSICVQFSGSEIGGFAQDVGISVYNVQGQQQIFALRTYARWNLTSASKFASSPILRDVKQTHQILQPTERPSHGARTDSGLHASYFFPDFT